MIKTNHTPAPSPHHPITRRPSSPFSILHHFIDSISCPSCTISLHPVPLNHSILALSPFQSLPSPSHPLPSLFIPFQLFPSLSDPLSALPNRSQSLPISSSPSQSFPSLPITYQFSLSLLSPFYSLLSLPIPFHLSPKPFPSLVSFPVLPNSQSRLSAFLSLPAALPEGKATENTGSRWRRVLLRPPGTNAT